MNTLILAAVVIASGAALYGALLLVISRLRQRCPACGDKTLASDESVGCLGTGSTKDGKRFPFAVYGFKCTACGAEFRQYNDDGLVHKDAWDRGARKPLPTATVIEKPE